MYVPEIIEVKTQFDKLKEGKLIDVWELPYENILTRRSAAIFFFTLAKGATLDKVVTELQSYDHFSVRENTEKKLSSLSYRVTFNQEEKEKNINPEMKLQTN